MYFSDTSNNNNGGVAYMNAPPHYYALWHPAYVMHQQQQQQHLMASFEWSRQQNNNMLATGTASPRFTPPLSSSSTSRRPGTGNNNLRRRKSDSTMMMDPAPDSAAAPSRTVATPHVLATQDFDYFSQNAISRDFQRYPRHDYNNSVGNRSGSISSGGVGGGNGTRRSRPRHRRPSSAIEVAIHQDSTLYYSQDRERQQPPQRPGAQRRQTTSSASPSMEHGSRYPPFHGDGWSSRRSSSYSEKARLESETLRELSPSPLAHQQRRQPSRPQTPSSISTSSSPRNDRGVSESLAPPRPSSAGSRPSFHHHNRHRDSLYSSASSARSSSSSIDSSRRSSISSGPQLSSRRTSSSRYRPSPLSRESLLSSSSPSSPATRNVEVGATNDTTGNGRPDDNDKDSEGRDSSQGPLKPPGLDSNTDVVPKSRSSSPPPSSSLLPKAFRRFSSLARREGLQDQQQVPSPVVESDQRHLSSSAPPDQLGKDSSPLSSSTATKPKKTFLGRQKSLFEMKKSGSSTMKKGGVNDDAMSISSTVSTASVVLRKMRSRVVSLANVVGRRKGDVRSDDENISEESVGDWTLVDAETPAIAEDLRIWARFRTAEDKDDPTLGGASHEAEVAVQSEQVADDMQEEEEECEYGPGEGGVDDDGGVVSGRQEESWALPDDTLLDDSPLSMMPGASFVEEPQEYGDETQPEGDVGGVGGNRDEVAVGQFEGQNPVSPEEDYRYMAQLAYDSMFWGQTTARRVLPPRGILKKTRSPPVVVVPQLNLGRDEGCLGSMPYGVSSTSLAEIVLPSADQIDGLERRTSRSSKASSFREDNMKWPMKENVDPSASVDGLPKNGRHSWTTTRTRSSKSSGRRRSSRAEEERKKVLTFASTLTVYETFGSRDYDRRSESATWSRLTPHMMMEIREELRRYKMEEMVVHSDSPYCT